MEQPQKTSHQSVQMTLHNLNKIKPEVKGTTLITYIVPGSVSM